MMPGEGGRFSVSVLPLSLVLKNLVFIGPEVWPPEIIQNSQVVPVVKNLPANARD